MNTNLNNIPLDIFLDYITEHTGQEWIIEFLCAIDYIHDETSPQHFSAYTLGNGFTYGYGYEYEQGYDELGWGNGMQGDHGCGYGHEFVPYDNNYIH